ncbi:MAG: O-antigen ligase family protein [Anaerolineales bacterium]
MLVTTDREVTFLAVSRLMAGLTLAYGIANWANSEGRWRLLALGMVVIGIGVASLIPFTMEWQAGPLNPIPRSWYNRLPRLLSDPLNPNMVAGSLVMLLPFPLVLMWQRRRWPSSIPLLPMFLARWLKLYFVRLLLASVALALMLLMVAMTQSRGGWIAAALVLFISFAFRFPWLWGSVPLSGLELWWMANQGRLAPLLDALGTGGAVVGWEERVEIWSRALYIIQDFPFTGIGAGTYYDVVSLLYPLFLISPDSVIPHAHNLLLEVAVDVGIPGLVAFVAILIIACFSGLRNIYGTTREHRIAAILSEAALASLAGMLAHGMVDATSWIIGWGALLPWAMIGILIGVDRVGRP